MMINEKERAIYSDYTFDNLRSKPKFQALLKEMVFPAVNNWNLGAHDFSSISKLKSSVEPMFSTS